MRRVPVLLPYPFPEPFDYAVPGGLDPAPGDAVLVPLNRRETVGVVWDAMPDAVPAARVVPDAKLKPIMALLDTPPMTGTMRRFVDWVAAYTLSPPGEVMAMALRITAPAPLAAGWALADPPEAGVRMTPARSRVLAELAEAEPRAGTELARAAEVSQAVLHGMAQAGLIRRVPLAHASPFVRPDPEHPGPVLSVAQGEAAAALRDAVAAQSFSVTLLDGVTGSGKTAVVAMAGAVRGAVRHGAGGVALRPVVAHAADDVAGRGRSCGAGGCRRALGAVPAVPQPRAAGGG